MMTLTLSRIPRRRILLSYTVCKIVLLLCHQGAYSFLLQRPRCLLAPSRTGQIICSVDQEEIRCWELQRFTHERPLLLRTVLHDNVDRELESPMKINGNSNQFVVNGDTLNGGVQQYEATGVSLFHETSNTQSNGHTNLCFNSMTNESTENWASTEQSDADAPKPTVNGGYAHTEASRAKIGAANKGKTPWNKGRHRSEEEKARIAAGVRARNRERFLQKLKDMGLTEEEHEAQKKEERRKKEAERRARRTEKGGYRPTEETKAKISRILKEKHARGEVKPRTVNPEKVRRGFTHSEETRRKISESLKKKWAADSGYRDRMTTSMKKAYSRDDVRKKVSQTLKKKWEDPKFREEMLTKMKKNRSSPEITEEYRQKISATMKKKWQNPEYRQKTLAAIAEHKKSLDRKPKARYPPKPKKPSREDGVAMARPQAAPKANRASRKTTTSSVRNSNASTTKTPAGKPAHETKSPEKKMVKEKKKKKEPDGSVNRLREERRDLFDLLYGDDDFEDKDVDDVSYDSSSDETVNSPLTERLRSRFDFDDEDLDAFNPYGLDDY